MSPSAYVRTTRIGREPDVKSVSEVEVTREGDENGQVVEVSWWPSLLDQWGKDGVRAYLEAEALCQFGYCDEARAKVEPFVEGENWATRWLNEHPVIVATPMVDPLA